MRVFKEKKHEIKISIPLFWTAFVVFPINLPEIQKKINLIKKKHAFQCAQTKLKNGEQLGQRQSHCFLLHFEALVS